MRTLSLLIFLSIQSYQSSLASFVAEGSFPASPYEKLTPGSVCNAPDSFRYPERIAYCERDVSRERKAVIFSTYDVELGFHTREMNRADFKIDHYIPLCMGGSNEDENLWPQHKTIYQQTDPIEPVLCELMSSGQMLQAKAISIIRQVKRNPETSGAVLRDLESKLRH